MFLAYLLIILPFLGLNLLMHYIVVCFMWSYFFGDVRVDDAALK